MRKNIDWISIVAVIIFLCVVGLVWFSATKSGRIYKERACEPVEGLYYRDRAGHLASVLTCDKPNT